MRRGRAKVAERNRDESAHRPEDLLAFRRTAMIKEADASRERRGRGGFWVKRLLKMSLLKH